MTGLKSIEPSIKKINYSSLLKSVKENRIHCARTSKSKNILKNVLHLVVGLDDNIGNHVVRLKQILNLNFSFPNRILLFEGFRPQVA